MQKQKSKDWRNMAKFTLITFYEDGGYTITYWTALKDLLWSVSREKLWSENIKEFKVFPSYSLKGISYKRIAEMC